MRRYLTLTIFAILLVLIATGYTALRQGRAESLTQPVAQQTEDETRTVQVTGVGEAQVEPDSAVISLGVQTEASTAEEALDENTASMQSLLETLDDSGIPTADIQTQTLNLFPRYEFDEESRTLVGYTASNIVQVQIDNLDTLGSLIDEAVSDGANTVENIFFEVSNPETVADQAREAAFQNARHKAEELADLGEASLGSILEIRETSSTPGPIARSFETADEAASVPISPGSQTVTVEVQITWTLLTNNGQ